MMAFRAVQLACSLLALPLLVQAAEVRLGWDAGAGDVPKGYIVERKVGATGAYAKVGEPLTTEWTDTDLPASSTTQLCWQVRAWNERGISDPSNEVCLSLPDVPVNVRIETVGPSATAPRVSVRTNIVKKK